MNWQHLRYFEVLATVEHFTKAAEQLYITQSALSKSIDSLEKELGVPLFERSGRNIRLNKYGRVFRNHVICATDEISKGIETIHNMSKTDSGLVSFASIFTMGTIFIPGLIKTFYSQYPNIRLAYYQKSTKNILNDILDGNIEFGFCGEFLRDGDYANIDTEMVMVEDICLAVYPSHPLAGRTSVRFEELMEFEFIAYTENTGIIHSLDEAITKAGYIPNLKHTYQAAEDNTVVAMVRAELGIAFVANNPTIYTEGVILIPTIEPFLSRKLYMAWRRNGYMSPAAKTFKYHVLSNI